MNVVREKLKRFEWYLDCIGIDFRYLHRLWRLDGRITREKVKRLPEGFDLTSGEFQKPAEMVIAMDARVPCLDTSLN